MLKWTGVTLALALSLAGLGCGGAQHGSVPVESPLWSPPANDPSAAPAAEDSDKDKDAKPPADAKAAEAPPAGTTK